MREMREIMEMRVKRGIMGMKGGMKGQAGRRCLPHCRPVELMLNESGTTICGV
jgi:hypothetical protein